MASTCKGEWRKSLIGGADDGVIEIKDTGGILTGKHKKSDRDIIGRCREGETPNIRFARMEDDGCVYVYDGDITHDTSGGADLFKINGTVTVFCPFAMDRKAASAEPPLPPDDWTAEKPT